MCHHCAGNKHIQGTHGLLTRQAVAQYAIVVRETSTFKAHMACLQGKLLHNVGHFCQPTTDSLANVVRTKHVVGLL